MFACMRINGMHDLLLVAGGVLCGGLVAAVGLYIAVVWLARDMMR